MKMQTQRKTPLALCAAICALGLGISATAQDRKPTIITFDAPGSVGGTNVQDISPAGAITGFFLDANNVFTGYLRALDGTFKVFVAPGAGTASYQGTFPTSINAEGAIAGYYFDPTWADHGFLRSPDGVITTVDVPGAIYTEAYNINAAGEIAGNYVDSSYVYQGFLLAPDGAFTTFSAPGAGMGTWQGTYTATVDALNQAGWVTGYFLDANSVSHGYVLAPDGAFSTFDAPGAGTGAYQGTSPSGINREGTVPGYYTDANGVR